MKIIALTAENIKRLVAVEIKPDGSLVQITGKNGQGKTSVLDSIWWALSGAKNIQAAPIRKGANQARIKLDMGEVIVTRTFQREKEGEGFTTKLEVVGAVKGTPQQMLDSLLDSLAFDPLKFARMDAKDQFEALKKYVPGVDFGKIAADNSIDTSNRKELNRRAKEARVMADKIEINMPVGERIDEAALIKELADAGKYNSDLQLRTERRRLAADAIPAKRQHAESLRQEADRLRKEAEEKAARLQAEADAIDKDAANSEKMIAGAPPLPQPINDEEIQAKIKNARGTNQMVALHEEQQRHKKLTADLEAQSKAITLRMEQREADKRAKIAAAQLPVEGITFGDDLVLLNGVPFDQASDAEQLRASCSLAMAGNPELRVIRVRDGSLLDEGGLALLAEMATERDFQVWVERCSNGENIGFVLVDGHLREEESQPSLLGDVEAKGEA